MLLYLSKSATLAFTRTIIGYSNQALPYKLVHALLSLAFSTLFKMEASMPSPVLNSTALQVLTPCTCAVVATACAMWRSIKRRVASHEGPMRKRSSPVMEFKHSNVISRIKLDSPTHAVGSPLSGATQVGMLWPAQSGAPHPPQSPASVPRPHGNPLPPSTSPSVLEEPGHIRGVMEDVSAPCEYAGGDAPVATPTPAPGMPQYENKTRNSN
jgi:hypothetical protein